MKLTDIFGQRFGTASLLSLLVQVLLMSEYRVQDQDNSASSYRAAVASSFAQSADQSLQQET